MAISWGGHSSVLCRRLFVDLIYQCEPSPLEPANPSVLLRKHQEFSRWVKASEVAPWEIHPQLKEEESGRGSSPANSRWCLSSKCTCLTETAGLGLQMVLLASLLKGGRYSKWRATYRLLPQSFLECPEEGPEQDGQFYMKRSFYSEGSYQENMQPWARRTWKEHRAGSICHQDAPKGMFSSCKKTESTDYRPSDRKGEQKQFCSGKACDGDSSCHLLGSVTWNTDQLPCPDVL